MAVLLWTPCQAVAGPSHAWQLDELAAAHVLVVGRILQFQKGGPTQAIPSWWSSESWSMIADVRVLRSFGASGARFPFDRFRLVSWACCKTPIVSGPSFPTFEPGQVYILALRENKDPVSQPWELLPDEGTGLTIPAREEMTFTERPSTARGFLLREIANTLTGGTPEEVSAAGEYLRDQHLNLTTDLMPFLEPAIGNDRQRWAEIATCILATTGIPRPSIAGLLSSNGIPEKWNWQKSSLIAQAALRKLGASVETNNLLIKTLIADAPVHAWGSATILLEFADNPVTIEALRQAMHDDLPGSSYIAWTLAHNGHQQVLKESLTRALKVVDRPAADLADLEGAAALLRDFGSDRQLDQLASLVRKYQTQDRKFYNSLWQWSTEAGSPREVRVLAVVLHDRHLISKDIRVCDFAVGVLERATGQHFDAGGKTLAEREAALTRATVWIRSEGISE
jgi:hypothetical protein